MKIKKLSYRTVLYVPTEYGNDKDIPENQINKMMERTLEEMINLGGGATVIDGTGYWYNQQQDKVGKMKTKLVMSYIDEIEKGIEVLGKLALWIKEESRSEAVCFEINNNLYVL